MSETHHNILSDHRHRIWCVDDVVTTAVSDSEPSEPADLAELAQLAEPAEPESDDDSMTRRRTDEDTARLRHVRKSSFLYELLAILTFAVCISLVFEYNSNSVFLTHVSAQLPSPSPSPSSSSSQSQSQSTSSESESESDSISDVGIQSDTSSGGFKFDGALHQFPPLTAKVPTELVSIDDLYSGNVLAEHGPVGSLAAVQDFEYEKQAAERLKQELAIESELISQRILPRVNIDRDTMRMTQQVVSVPPWKAAQMKHGGKMVSWTANNARSFNDNHRKAKTQQNKDNRSPIAAKKRKKTATKNKKKKEKKTRTDSSDATGSNEAKDDDDTIKSTPQQSTKEKRVRMKEQQARKRAAKKRAQKRKTDIEQQDTSSSDNNNDNKTPKRQEPRRKKASNKHTKNSKKNDRNFNTPRARKPLGSDSRALLCASANRLRVRDPQRMLFIITPTFERSNQAVELTAIANSLKEAKQPLLWIVIEDSRQHTDKDYMNQTLPLLEQFRIPYVFLRPSLASKNQCKHMRNGICDNRAGHRGVSQRNLALRYLRELWYVPKELVSALETDAVFMSADTDRAGQPLTVSSSSSSWSLSSSSMLKSLVSIGKKLGNLPSTSSRLQLDNMTSSSDVRRNQVGSIIHNGVSSVDMLHMLASHIKWFCSDQPGAGRYAGSSLTFESILHEGVVHFEDDDNLYHPDLFPDIRSIVKPVGVFPVFFPGRGFDTPTVVKGTELAGFDSVWCGRRHYAVDMGGIAFPISSLFSGVCSEYAFFSTRLSKGWLETSFVFQLIGYADDTPKTQIDILADGCTQVYAYHLPKGDDPHTLEFMRSTFPTQVEQLDAWPANTPATTKGMPSRKARQKQKNRLKRKVCKVTKSRPPACPK
jgi:Glycosyltransferase family 43